MPDQKNKYERCLGGFSVMWITKLLLPPLEIRIFCANKAKFGPKYAVVVILGQILPEKNNAKKVSRWFSVKWATKLLLSSVKIRIFGQKDSHLVSCWLVGWWFGARAVSRKTPIYFM